MGYLYFNLGIIYSIRFSSKSVNRLTQNANSLFKAGTEFLVSLFNKIILNI